MVWGNKKRINEIEINCFTAYSYSVHKNPNDDDVDWSADLCTPHGSDLAVLNDPHKMLDMMRQIRSVNITSK